TPWAAARLLRARREGSSHEEDHEDRTTRAYRWVMSRLVGRSAWRWSFLVLTVVLLLGAMAFIPAGWVGGKMLPSDKQSAPEIVLNIPEHSSVDGSASAAREIAAAVRTEKEVTDYQVYVGIAAPYSFNGLVRHYYLRQGSSVAEVQLNLLPKHERSVQS